MSLFILPGQNNNSENLVACKMWVDFNIQKNQFSLLSDIGPEENVADYGVWIKKEQCQQSGVVVFFG